MNENQSPIKHHYIPQFYLKSFSCCDDYNLYVLDKKYKNINQKKPSQIFYEKNLHTAEFFGEKTYFIENAYSDIEGLFSKIVSEFFRFSTENFDSISNNKEWANIIKMMVSIQFWRNPINTEISIKKSEKLLDIFDNSIFYNKDVMPFDRKDIKFLFKKRNKKWAKKVIQFFVLPLITFKFDGGVSRRI